MGDGGWYLEVLPLKIKSKEFGQHAEKVECTKASALAVLSCRKNLWAGIGNLFYIYKLKKTTLKANGY